MGSTTFGGADPASGRRVTPQDIEIVRGGNGGWWWEQPLSPLSRLKWPSATMTITIEQAAIDLAVACGLSL